MKGGKLKITAAGTVGILRYQKGIKEMLMNYEKVCAVIENVFIVLCRVCMKIFMRSTQLQ